MFFVATIVHFCSKLHLTPCFFFLLTVVINSEVIVIEGNDVSKECVQTKKKNFSIVYFNENYKLLMLTWWSIFWSFFKRELMLLAFLHLWISFLFFFRIFLQLALFSCFSKIFKILRFLKLLVFQTSNLRSRL